VVDLHDVVEGDPGNVVGGHGVGERGGEPAQQHELPGGATQRGET
jgi:hypothetical protein